MCVAITDSISEEGDDDDYISLLVKTTNDKHNCYYYTRLTVSFPGQPGQGSTRKVKAVWI